MKDKELIIFINSSKRSDNVRTVRQFPSSWKRFTRIVTPFDQAPLYRALGWPVIPIPKGVPQFLSSQRQWVMENADCDYVFMMDDDLDFCYRLPGGTSLRKSGDEQMEAMLVDVQATMVDFPLVGISTRLGNNRVTQDHDDINRVTRCYCIDRNVFQTVGCTFAPYEPFAMQDFHINLCFLEKGYPNRILYKYAQGDPGSNTPGGVSSYRTFEVHQRAAKYLMTHHPGVVRLQVKATKAGWTGFKKMGDETLRTDVVVSWKKAYTPRKHGVSKTTASGIASFFRK